MDNIPEGKYIDTGTNNGGTCSAPSEGSKPVTIPTPRPRPTVPTTASTTTPFSSASYVDCLVQDGLFPDPHNCRGFIKCAQVEPCRYSNSKHYFSVFLGWLLPNGVWGWPVFWHCDIQLQLGAGHRLQWSSCVVMSWWAICHRFHILSHCCLYLEL